MSDQSNPKLEERPIHPSPSIAGPKPMKYWSLIAGSYFLVSLGAIASAVGLLGWYSIPASAESVGSRLVISAMALQLAITALAVAVHMAHDYRRRYHLLRDQDVVRDLYPTRDRLRTKYQNVLLDSNETFRVVGISLHTLMSEPSLGEWITEALSCSQDLKIDFCFQKPYSTFVRSREREEGKGAGRISQDCLQDASRALQIKRGLGDNADRFRIHQVESIPVGFFLQRDQEIYFEPYLAREVGRTFPTFVMARNEQNSMAFDKFVAHIDAVIEDASEFSEAAGTAEPLITQIGESTSRRELQRAVFLDRDGVLVEDTGYISDPDHLRLLPGVVEGLRELQDNYRLIVITNQSGVARGFFTEADLFEINSRLVAMLADKDVYLDAVYYCPHHPDVGNHSYKRDCNCRKPNPGLLTASGEYFGITLSESFAIGDMIRDIEAGNAAGVKTILVGDKERIGADLADSVVTNFSEISATIRCLAKQ